MPTPDEISPTTPALDEKLPRFALGQVVATPGSLSALVNLRTSPWTLLSRHVRGDWGELDDHDWQENERALTEETRLLSAYTLPGETRIWIITEADRSATTLLLPQEY